MKLEILSFADAGHFAKERIVFKALSDADLGDYVVFCSHVSTKENPTSGRKLAYWFPDGEVKAGDLIVLYTKTGATSAKPQTGGHTAHFFYWGNDTAIWAGGNGAVLLLADDWDFKIPK